MQIVEKNPKTLFRLHIEILKELKFFQLQENKILKKILPKVFHGFNPKSRP